MIDTKVETMIETTTTNPRIGIAIEIDKTTVNDPSQEKIDATAAGVHQDNDTTTIIGTPNTLDNEHLQEITDNETTQETATIVAMTPEAEVNRLINRQAIDEQQHIQCN